MSRNTLVTCSLIGILGALIGAVADVLLLYTPDARYETGSYLFFNDIAYWRLLAGHYLGILFIPLELFGLAAFLYCLQPLSRLKNSLLLCCTFMVMMVGVTYHATLGQLAIYIKTGGGSKLLHLYQSFSEPLSVGLFLIFLILCIIIAHHLFTQPTMYPKWMAFLSPICIYAIIGLWYFAIGGSIANILIVAGFNLSIAVFLLGHYFFLQKSYKTS